MRTSVILYAILTAKQEDNGYCAFCTRSIENDRTKCVCPFACFISETMKGDVAQKLWAEVKFGLYQSNITSALQLTD